MSHGVAPYRAAITSPAARELEKLPEKVATACLEFIFDPLANNPHRCGKALRNELAGSYSARRGDYRVIYAIRDDEKIVEIEHINRRSDVYR